MRVLLALTLAMVVVGGFAIAGNNNSTAAEKMTIKQVMKAANAGESSLFKKVASGNATAEEKLKLVDLYIDMLENDAPKGDAIEWKMAAGTAMVAAAKVAVGREDSLKELADAVNCKACHDKFKGK